MRKRSRRDGPRGKVDLPRCCQAYVSGPLSFAYIVQVVQSFALGELVLTVEIVNTLQIDPLTSDLSPPHTVCFALLASLPCALRPEPFAASLLQ
jgi:hypothetical protein